MIGKTGAADCCGSCMCGAGDPCCNERRVRAPALRSTRAAGAQSVLTRRPPLGHTAYHHVGHDGLGYTPTPSSPYYLFGYQHRLPYNWAGGAGGTPWSNGRSRELGNADLLESGAERVFPHFPAFNRTMLHDPRYEPTGDWPLVRPQGPEPVGFSDNEKRLGMVIALGAVGWMIWKKMGARRSNPSRNPIRKRYEVVASTGSRKRRRRYGSIGFTTKGAAQDYADYLRKGGHKARVRKK